ncbi:NACHT domain-containing protein [Mycobacterium montefiorense]|uniref:Uncharacterized protein n=1 Tax=Mycobacterium montefiorense TaxID=154654 RepID=A0AA37UT72_9MYCO|nr:hypothetical protein [Mycobacterium montefiorense]GBG38681.1 hypothetical protein MmonteBS_30530 [Mycobacterium montefiorense]GKU34509.1 hypothetical protein NJB14191_18550 [Mycobacterium montefiorense]GKU39130.1 hypothetical protein NJB14192_11260 [Mycobacterium montefiorense]GKU43555.1 hypothetical protein NJB14194_01880 [Mycobacterium montefiorense]GKU49895.1 hypothetical protein NJB14195_11410 [Mycobacterium montefiorense]
MPDLNWDAFLALTGDARNNFERICRAATSHAYGRYGRLAAQAQQPGVEFHLQIERAGCALGDAGRWFGWQTKWWSLGSGRPIGTTRRDDVIDSIRVTERHIPEITDWVLWTRYPLTAGDQEWFFELDTDMELHLWTETELDELLFGDAELLRETYFGDLILTAGRLADYHEQAAAEVGDRWVSEVHQPSPAEHALRRMLAEPEGWKDLQRFGRDIERFTEVVDGSLASMQTSFASQVESILNTSRNLVDVLKDIYGQFDRVQSSALIGIGRRPVPVVDTAMYKTVRRLRACQHASALPVTNLLAHMRDAADLAANVEEHLTTRIAVVKGEAGFGKTQLAANISAPTASRPAGILLFGGRLSVRGSLDDLAHQVVVAGSPLHSFEALLAAVDAAAARAGCRLPVVIDGLNEAEAATTWTPLLRRLITKLEKYPSVLVVCTVRASFFDDAVPSEFNEILSLEGFDEDLDEAIERYFTYYKIDPADAELPREVLNHPLSLKIYCTVANPERKELVSVERLPATLSAMFEDFLLAIGRRVHQLNTAIQPYEVAQALDALGKELWETRARYVSQERARELFGDAGGWQRSVLAALEREGVLIRQPGEVGGAKVGLVYDLLAGHVIASSLLRAQGAGIADLVANDEMTKIFAGPFDERHPLAVDTFEALAGLMPRRGAPQLWQVVPRPLRLAALLRAATLEADHLDSATVNALAENVDALRWRRDDLFDRLFTTRAAPLHPLNAEFLDRVLRPRGVADRDLRWSEWLRNHASSLRADANALAARWRAKSDRSSSDYLRAQWLMWTLTSSDRALRDAATAALYWFGRCGADGLFAIAADALTINDAYVVDRMTAVSYGVMTSKQLPEKGFDEPLSSLLRHLADAFTGEAALAPTWHSLTRHYVSSMFEFASRFYPTAIPPEVKVPLAFVRAPIAEPLREGDPRRDEADHTLGMDFGNYTLGRLFRDRSNYDDDHPAHRDATDHLLGVVYALGWRSDLFETIEREIISAGREDDPGRLERYGKKYGWVGLYTVAGMLADEGQSSEVVEVDIDPTFPQAPPCCPHGDTDVGETDTGRRSSLAAYGIN